MHGRVVSSNYKHHGPRSAIHFDSLKQPRPVVKPPFFLPFGRPDFQRSQIASDMAEVTQSILVLGAGELGTAVLKALVAHPQRQGATIFVLLRQETIDTTNPEKRKEVDSLRELGIRLVAGDITTNTIQELAAIFRQFDTVVGCSGYSMPPGTQLKLTEAALTSGVPRYLPWQWGLDFEAVGAGSAHDLFDEQLAVRKRLGEQTATDWLVVSTGLFTSFLFIPEFGPVDLPNRTLRCLGSWDTSVSLTTPHDIGIMAAELVFQPDQGDKKRNVVYIAGDTVTYDRVATLVQQRFPGESFRKEAWDLDLLKRRLTEKPGDKLLKYQNVFAAGRGVAFDLAKTANVQRGIPLEGLESYLKGVQLP